MKRCPKWHSGLHANDTGYYCQMCNQQYPSESIEEFSEMAEELVNDVSSYVSANGLMGWTAPGLAKYLIDSGWMKKLTEHAVKETIKDIKEGKKQ